MSNNNPNWQFDEFTQVGRDYADDDEVEVYDETHAQFRDFAAEAKRALELLDLKPAASLIDVGCGTGNFLIHAAKAGVFVHGADVSKPMLKYAEHKTGDLPVSLHHAGFLSLDFPDEYFDAITTTFAFHHLPDFWKGVALERMNALLKPGGRIYLCDVILQPENCMDNIEQMIQHQYAAGGDFLRDDAIGHFREEFSTYDWVMEGLFQQAGFNILFNEFEGGLIGTYLCEKPSPSASVPLDPTTL